jgi:uncharacterized protein YuzE
MKLSYDKSIDAAYIQLALEIDAGGVAKTYPCDPLAVEGQINLDFDAAGRLVGIEILGASRKLPPELLRQERS